MTDHPVLCLLTLICIIMPNEDWCHLVPKFISLCVSGVDSLILLGKSMGVKRLNSVK